MKANEVENFNFFYSGIQDRLKKQISELNDPEYIVKAQKVLEPVIEKARSDKRSKKIKIIEIPDVKKLLHKYHDYLVTKGKSGSTVIDYPREASRFIKYLEKENIKLGMVDLDIYEQYISQITEGLAQSSRARIVFSLRSFFQFLNMKSYTDIDIDNISVTKWDRKSVVREKFSDEELEKINTYLLERTENFKNENLRDRLFIGLGHYCGLRRSEMINLKWDDIDTNAKKITVRRSKGGKSRFVYFGDKLFSLLKEYRKKTGCYQGYVLRGIQGRKMHKNSLQNAFSRILKVTKIYRKGLSLHSLRHTYATIVYKKYGAAVAQLLLGHSRLDTTGNYLHIDDVDLRNSVID